MSILGFAHLRRVAPEAEIFPKMTPTVPATTAIPPGHHGHGPGRPG